MVSISGTMLHLRLNSPLLASMLAFVWNSRKWFREELAFTIHRYFPCEVLRKSRGAYFHPCCRYLSHNGELDSAANISLNVFEMEVSLWNDVTFVILLNLTFAIRASNFSAAISLFDERWLLECVASCSRVFLRMIWLWMIWWFKHLSLNEMMYH